MIKRRKLFITVALCAAASEQAWAQAAQFVTLDIEFENGVTYTDNIADPSKLVTSPGMVGVNLRNLMANTTVADIVSVNGKPARGIWAGRGRFILLRPSPVPGQAIGDVSRGALVDDRLEILQTDGTPVGTIMSSGFAGGSAPPGAPADFSGNIAVIGGTGAFLGARGMWATPPSFSVRLASVEEDPANRRTFGGGRGHHVIYLIPLSRPEIVTTANGPAVFHSDFSPLTATKPARAGETLIVTATGLGPTSLGFTLGTPFPDNPLQQVNSPVDVTVNGKPADVVNKVGWPGTTDTYRLDIRVPDGTAPGMAALQVTAAFIPGQAVSIPLQ